MEIKELNKMVERLRMISDAKLKYLRDRAKLLDEAFDELQQITEGELDIIYDKIQEIDKRMDVNGLSK